MDIASNKVVGRRIRIYREQAGLSQAELGRRVGRSQSEIAKIEMGERQLPYVESFWFAEALGKGYDVLAEEIHQDLLDTGLNPSQPPSAQQSKSQSPDPRSLSTQRPSPQQSSTQPPSSQQSSTQPPSSS